MSVCSLRIKQYSSIMRSLYTKAMTVQCLHLSIMVALLGGSCSSCWGLQRDAAKATFSHSLRYRNLEHDKATQKTSKSLKHRRLILTLDIFKD